VVVQCLYLRQVVASARYLFDYLRLAQTISVVDSVIGSTLFKTFVAPSAYFCAPSVPKFEEFLIDIKTGKMSLHLALFSVFFVAVVANEAFIDRTEPMEIPTGWKLHSVAHPEHEIRLILAIKQRNLDRFTTIFNQITDPKSDKYAQYWTIDDLTEMIAPSDETIQAVSDWLDSHHISKRNMTTNKDFIHAWVPVSKAEEMLGVQYFNWIHDKYQKNLIKINPFSGKKVTATLGPYRTPIKVAKHLDFITGGLGIPRDLVSFW
jgi:hypothetical protein